MSGSASGSGGSSGRTLSSGKFLAYAVGVSAVITALIFAFGGRLESVRLLPDQGASWYYWKLPDPTFMTHFTAWIGYVAHQIAVFYLIFRAARRNLRFTAGLHRENIVLAGANLAFIGLHFLQTHLWYDGLAQDVPVWSSQGSVIVMLVLILIMENSRRGLFFGKKVPLPARAVDLVRRYHGYLIAWALVYTFWFHPLVSTSGHLAGFFYMFLLFTQMSLMYTRAHLNKYWTFTLEVAVLVHGTLVALMNTNGLWPMFAFGFGGVLVITQIYGIGLPKWAIKAVSVLYILLVAGVYGGILAEGRTPADVNEIVRIPIIEYALVFLFVGIIMLGLSVRRLFAGRKPAAEKDGTQ